MSFVSYTEHFSLACHVTHVKSNICSLPEQIIIYYTSSSFNSMLGIPFLIGNFLPDSGQTSDPSSTSTCKNVLTL